MKAPNLLLAFCFIYHCQAGPVFAFGAAAAEAVFGFGEAALTTFFSSSFASLFGIGASGIWYGDFVIVNGALYYGSAIVGGGTLAGGAAAAGACGAGKCKPVTDLNAKQSSSVMSALSSASVASVSAASVAAISASKHSVSVLQQVSTGASSAKASMQAMASAQSSYNTAVNPFSFSEHHKRRAAPAAAVSIGPPPGTPVLTLPAAQRPSEVPAGIPEYNFRMCQHDIIQMGIDGKHISIDSPDSQSILVGNIPSTCMVLSTLMTGDPALGPHPIPQGASSLQWNGMSKDQIDAIRIFLGLKPTDPNADQKEILNRFVNSIPKARRDLGRHQGASI